MRKRGKKTQEKKSYLVGIVLPEESGRNISLGRLGEVK